MNNKRKKRIIISLSFLLLIICSITFVYTYSINTPIIKEYDENNSQIIGNTVYINELETDYYYYTGLNYTYHINDGYHNDNNMPTLNNQNKYNTNNLVQVKITYKSEDFNNNKGYVSLTELQDTYVYNKIFEVNNGYVQIELIDNPFTNRPNNMGFNGWITQDNNVEFIKDETYGTISARIPVTITNNVPDMINITFNASWVLANTANVGGSNSWNTAFSNLKEKQMIKIDTTENDNYINNFSEQSIMAGYYKAVNKNNGESVTGLYNNLGVKQENSTCNNGEGCIYYEYIKYYDNNNNINYINKTDNYYYLNTKETNIIVLTESINSVWTSNKEFTLTSVYNGVDYRDNAIWDVSTIPVVLTADTNIENIKISSGKNNDTVLPSATNDTSGTLYARWYKVKLGRGIIKNGNYTNFSNIMAGYNENVGASHETKKYKIKIESGFYDNISLTSGTSNYTNNVNVRAVLGNDYDKATKNNNLLQVYYTTSGSYGSNVASPNYRNTDIISTIVKSGSFGTSKIDSKTGIVAGSVFGGTHNSPKNIKIEGGWIYNLIGDASVEEGRKTFIDVKMFISGGRIEMVIGGSNNTSTYGHRFIQVTGGTIGYSVIGGNNSYNDEATTLDGNIVIYIGGNAIIGDDEYIENKNSLYGVTSGNVFGLSNGNKNSTNKVNNSNIIINDEAIIKQNVYLGGNYSTSGTKDSVKLKLLGGTINNSIYGGGKYVGLGTEQTLKNVSIETTDGTVLGAIYGGSEINGTIYGDTNININGGNINEIYGGGKNGSTDEYLGTIVTGNIKINVGNNQTNPTIKKIYGGSEYGIVNGTTITKNVSDKNIVINVYNGNITNIYGGSKGSSDVIPHILGSTTVNISGGKIENVYGANDVSGVPNGGSKVYLKGGNITNAYGGGNSADINTTNIELDGATVTSLFGGSNVGGTASITNVVVNSGTATAIHGGNDYGGFTEVSNVNINGGVITYVYGGGRYASSGITNVSLNKTNITNAFGGGENADVTIKSNITLNGSNVKNVYGGSDRSGNVKESNIKLVAGDVENIFGGNNLGGITYTTNVDVNGSRMQTIYGGGNEAYTENSTVIVRGSNNKLKNVYGGSKLADVNTSKVEVLGGMIENVYGGSHLNGNVTNSSVLVDSTKNVVNDVYLDISLDIQKTTWQSTEYKNIAYVTINFVNDTDNQIIEYNGTLVTLNSKLFENYTSTELTENDGTYTFTEINRYWGTNPIPAHGSVKIEFSILTNEDIEDFVLDNMFDASDDKSNKYNSSSLSIPKIDNIYGGNNQGGQTSNTDILIKDGLISYIYGGGNNAASGNTKVNVTGGEVYQDIYGGGNNASTNNIDVKISSINVGGNIYGGGNLGLVNENTLVHITDSTIGKSVYAGGNGMSATVLGNTKINIDGTTKINKSLFGGGNAANTGSPQKNNSKSVVNIAGGTINENVYGGANTAILYGIVNVNIGLSNISDNLKKGDISIKGTVFGGGEANAEGDIEYDYSFISVTKGIEINIDGKENINILGSIFGSGNASSTSGYSYINIKNYGNLENIKRNISIQRTDVLTIDNSIFELIGTTDRTNEYSDILYSLSKIGELKLKNNSTLYLKNGANLLNKLTSLNNEEKAQVIIKDNNYEKNVDNRIYLYEKTALNVSLNEQVTTYGEVSGMTFLGMYKYDEDENIKMYLYDPKYTNGSEVPNSDLYAFNDGVYVLGKHLYNHDITVDGFYTNKLDIESLDSINYEYVNVTPKDANYYMWVVGELVMEYKFDLTASKYSTLGTYELSLINSSAANTTFKILNFDYSDLNENLKLVNYDEVPRISTTNEAQTKMGLSLKTSNTGWITVGETLFFTNEEKFIDGATDYLSENSNVVPSLLFSLYHSKNITSNEDLGKVVITLLSLTPINEVENKIERINIVINLKTALYSTDNYEGVMTQGEEFDIFTPTTVDITTKSKLSAYYSLYKKSEQNIYRNGYHRVLLSNYVLPENTKITMVDLNSVNKEYYYYVVTKDIFEEKTQEFEFQGEVVYEFSDFIKMGSFSIDNKYNNELGNSSYYNNGYAHEEFIFIVDFSETNINEDKLQNTLLVELRDENDRTLYSVLGVQHADLTYNMYTNKDAIIEIDASLDTDKLYIGNNSILTINTNFLQQNNDDALIYDTNFFGKKLGVKITFIDSNGKQLTGTDLLGIYYEYNDNKYYPRVDGSIRINLAQRVANVSSKIMLNTENANIASGSYKIKIESFGSADGIYYGLESSDTKTLSVNIIDTMFGLNVTLPSHSIIVNKETGFGTNENNALVFNSKYSSGLTNPNLTISLYRRDYSYIDSNIYNKVDILDYITNDLKPKQNTEKEYIVSTDPTENQNLFIYMKENLITGTYKFVFTLYDGNTYIGNVYQYVIIK